MVYFKQTMKKDEYSNQGNIVTSLLLLLLSSSLLNFSYCFSLLADVIRVSRLTLSC
jgi:hypothetical protein